MKFLRDSGCQDHSFVIDGERLTRSIANNAQ